MSRQTNIDWIDCDLVERIPGKCGGRATIKGTRIEPDAIVTDAEMGATPEEMHQSFPSVPVSTIEGILKFARSYQPTP
jgi:uncharacterized protein (DUF433 family)